MAIIRMRDHLYDEIVNYAKEHLPEEACGLLAGVETGEGREIRKVYFLENKDHAEDHFPDTPVHTDADSICSPHHRRRNRYTIYP